MVSLAISVCAVAVVLLVPGYFLLRAVGVARAWSLALAPVFSVAMVSLLGELYATVGIDSTPASLVFVPAILLFVVVAARRFSTGALDLPRLDMRLLAFYAFVGFAVGFVVFVRVMGNTDSYFRGVDIVQHLNETRAFIDSKTFTSLHASYYLSDPSLDPAPVHYFYPSGYHAVCALATMICGQEITTVINALNLCSCALVWTLGLAATFTLIFKEAPRATAFGAIVAVAASIFPWGLLLFGPIFPNLLSFAMAPAVIVLFVFALQDGRAWWQRAIALVLMVVALAGIAMTQPNAAFTAAVFLIPYVFARILSLRGREIKRFNRTISWPVVVVLEVLWLVACWRIWMFLLHFDPLYGIVSFRWDFYQEPLDAVLNALCFSNVYDFNWVAAQPVMGVLALFGVAYTIWRKDLKLRWLCWTALLGQGLAVCCFIDWTQEPLKSAFAGIWFFLTGSDETTIIWAKNYFGGFWYTDPWRMSCMAVMLTLPLCVLGLVCIAELVDKAVARVRMKRAAKAAGDAGAALEVGDAAGAAADKAGALVAKLRGVPASSFVTAAVGLVAVIAMYWGCVGPIAAPEGEALIVPIRESAWACFRRTVELQYHYEAPYTRWERSFVDAVVDYVDGGTVLNDPFDGSVIAYGADGLNTYYRYVREYITDKETPDSKYLRDNIDDVATDEEVQRILEEHDVHYLLELSHDDFHGTFFMGDDFKGSFTDMENIDENTPGFEKVLEYLDYSLYRITALDDEAA